MKKLLAGSVVAMLFSMGCSGTADQTAKPGDPRAGEVLMAHWEALQRGDWRGAYETIHPDLKTAGLTLKHFTALNARRVKMKGAPQRVEVAGAEQTGDDVTVSYDVCAVPADGGMPVAVPPRRKATLRKSGGAWALLTHDILALQR